MVQIFLVADMERGPAGIGDPMVLLCQTVCQEPVPNRAGKGNVNHAPFMHVSEFGVSETKFAAPKAVRVNRYVRPACDFRLDLPEVRHDFISGLYLRTSISEVPSPKFILIFDDPEPGDDSKVFGLRLRKTKAQAETYVTEGGQRITEGRQRMA